MRAFHFVGLVLLLGVAGASFSSCVPTAVNTETPNSLYAQPASVAVSSIRDTQETILHLTCGCEFPLSYFRSIGDSSVIQYIATEPMTTVESGHRVQFYVVPTAAPGNYATNVIFYATDGNGALLFDTVRVTASIP